MNWIEVCKKKDLDITNLSPSERNSSAILNAFWHIINIQKMTKNSNILQGLIRGLVTYTLSYYHKKKSSKVNSENRDFVIMSPVWIP